jgi:hypothetical protein
LNCHADDSRRDLAVAGESVEYRDARPWNSQLTLLDVSSALASRMLPEAAGENKGLRDERSLQPESTARSVPDPGIIRTR